MEDVELSRRLNALGRQRYVDCPVTVASRRFERLGWTKVVLGNLGLRMAYRLGGQRAVHALYRYYYPTLSS